MTTQTRKLDIKINENFIAEISPRKSSYIKKAVIEEFLPRFGNNSEIIFIADTANRILYFDEEQIKELNFYVLLNDELPDIIAYSKGKNWVYMIEAVHSSGPMSEARVFELKKMMKDCKAKIVFITAFGTKTDFKNWVLDIAEETTVWTADNPDHLIHFNGHKFLGPY